MQTLRTSNRSALLHIPTALRAQTCFSGHDSTSFQNPCAMPKPGEVQGRAETATCDAIVRNSERERATSQKGNGDQNQTIWTSGSSDEPDPPLAYALFVQPEHRI